MALSNKKRIILSKIETAAGTSVASVMSAADAVLCSNLTISPLEGSVVERNLIRPYFGSAGTSRAENFVTLSFDTELASGTGTSSLPQWDNLIKSCGFSRSTSGALAATQTGGMLSGTVGAATAVVAPATTTTTIVLATIHVGPSITDDYYKGWAIRVGAQLCGIIIGFTALTKTATVSVPITAAQTLSTTYDLINGSTLSSGAVGATTTAIGGTVTLASTANANDGYYVGCSIRIETATPYTGVITGYVGSTKVATVSTATIPIMTTGTTQYVLSGATHTTTMLKLAANAAFTDDYYIGLTLTATTLVPKAVPDGTPVPVVETREILFYSGVTRTAQLNAALTTAPNPSTTYALGGATIYALSSETASIGDSSSTFIVNIDKQNHIVYGARGTFSLDLTVKQLPMIKWSFTGLLGDTAANISQLNGGSLVGDFTAWESPVVVNSVNTSQLNLCGNAPAISKVSIDIGNAVVHRMLIGAESVIVSDRKPKGSVTIEATDSTMIQAYLALIKSDNAAPFYLRHGAAAGDWVSIWAPKCQLGNIKYAEQDSMVMLDMSMDFQPMLSTASTGGNNELRIVCK